MKELSWLLITLIFAVNLGAIYHLIRRTRSSTWTKFFWVIVVFLLPVIRFSLDFHSIIRGLQFRLEGIKKNEKSALKVADS